MEDYQLEKYQNCPRYKSTFEVDGKKIVRFHYPEIISTQVFCRDLCLSRPIKDYILVTADKQTQGQGSHSRKWASDVIGNCYMTLIKPNFPANSIYNIFHHAAIPSIAVMDTIKDEFALKGIEKKLQMKWPNDILIEGKKSCGILPEILSENCEENKANILLGIGININMPQEVLDTIDQPCNSLSAASGLSFSVETFIRKFLTNYFSILKIYSGEEGLNKFKKDYIEKSAFLKDKVKVKDDSDGKFYEGFIKDITSEGVLILDINGNTKEFLPGHGTLRKAD